MKAVRRHRVLSAIALLVVLGAALYPTVGGAAGLFVLRRELAARMPLDLQVGRARASLSGLDLRDVVVRLAASGAAPAVELAKVERVEIPFAAAWGKRAVKLEGPRVRLAGDMGALMKLRQRLLGARRSGAGGAPRSGAGRRLPPVEFVRGTLELGAESKGKHLFVRELSGALRPGERLHIDLLDVRGAAASGNRDTDSAGFGAERVRVAVALEGMRPRGVPEIDVTSGYAQILPGLGLSGIAGRVAPAPTDPGRVSLQFSGSYGGSRQTLWRANGAFKLGKWVFDSEGHVAIRAERFTLGKIRDVLPPSVLSPERTSIDAALDLRLHAARLAVAGRLDIVDLSLFHPAVAADPVEDLRLSLQIDATLDPLTRSLQIASIEGRLRDLVGKLSGQVTLAPGQYEFEDGSQLPWLPRLDLALSVPKIPCQKVLRSFPGALIPHLQDFKLDGNFQADLKTQVDYADLDSLVLDGSVGIDGCRVRAISESVAMLTAEDAVITQEVEVPPAWDSRTQESEFLSFIIGPDNPDFIPYGDISTHMVNAVLTTEDSRFFRHRGFATAEFKTALKRNLARGGFRLGASSITMQLVKNLLLSHEKTLSRKLQELFLVWYVEQWLSKERILELYLNAIEFGPRLYGIGPAVRHYFGKLPNELTPAEAVFLSSLLPSPKRRYVHYCHGAISESWQRHIKRVLQRMNERERLTSEELDQSLTEMPTFDLTARVMSERQCLEWVKRITSKLDPEPPETARR